LCRHGEDVSGPAEDESAAAGNGYAMAVPEVRRGPCGTPGAR
jgi:hypothetical protein